LTGRGSSSFDSTGSGCQKESDTILESLAGIPGYLRGNRENRLLQGAPLDLDQKVAPPVGGAMRKQATSQIA